MSDHRHENGPDQQAEDAFESTIGLPRPDDLPADSLTLQLVEVLDQYMADLAAGRAPSRQELLKRHPQLASRLNACLDGVDFIHGSGGPEQSPPRRLGDFAIGREVGRGGMGAVYEAEQISLGRKVAIKVLRFGSVSDSEAINRFKREAETVANLHHTNIVPIFSVGSDDGVSYYAMQFIEGNSLDRIVKDNEHGISAKTVADWGLQAAEALAHAHQREVIHRDVKPSNLLLDEEGRIWLTDFGLAKRLDDVTLSMTGALLGTPRYMSPEQAESATKQIDHRTDIYSLGATLYELATGRPVFSSETPLGVINQIIHAEPMPPRRVHPGLPRDFETVLLKCLSKKASERYGTARELSEDLRAIVEDRPIKARRPRIIERTARWIKKNHRTASKTAATIIFTLLTISSFFAGQEILRQMRLSTLSVTSKTSDLVAEIHDGNGDTQFAALPLRRPLSVASGQIDVQLSGTGQLSQHYGMNLVAGVSKTVAADLGYQRIGRELDIDDAFCLMPFSDGLDPVLINETGIRRWDAASNTNLWSVDLKQTERLLAPVAEPFSWSSVDSFLPYLSADKYNNQPFVLGQADVLGGQNTSQQNKTTPAPIDLNSDGEIDLLIASRAKARIVAICGRTGSVLWETTRGSEKYRYTNAVLAPPVAIGDLDNDGVHDVAIMFGEANVANRDATSVPSNQWIEAISGSSGKTIWRFDIHEDWLDSVHDDAGEVPYMARWFVGSRSGSSTSSRVVLRSGPAGITSRSPGLETRRTGLFSASADLPHVINLTTPEQQKADVPASGGGRNQDGEQPALVFVCGPKIVLVDVFTGKQLGTPHETGVVSDLPARYADMDGDGVADVVLCKSLTGANLETVRSPNVAERYQITVWSLANREIIWQRDFTASWPRQAAHYAAPPNWPVLCDLADDGSCEMLIPNLTPDTSLGGKQSAPQGGVAVIDGKTGATKWERQLFTLDQQLDHFVSGPDLDEDGVQEIFVASLWGSSGDLYLDALSGTTGKTLWRTRHAVDGSAAASGIHRIRHLAWCDSGDDGWPQLSVSLFFSSMDEDNGQVLLFSAGTGEFQRLAKGAAAMWCGDVNLDGVDDLCAYVPLRAGKKGKGKLSLYRGHAAEYWRKLGESGVPGFDFDDDGVVDILRKTEHSQIEASSGVSGQWLWTSNLNSPFNSFQVIRQTEEVIAGHSVWDLQRKHDLDQDGSIDALIGVNLFGREPASPLHAISGKTGELLWSADIEVTNCQRCLRGDIIDLDGDGKLEIVYVGVMDLDYPQSDLYTSLDVQLWLVVLSGQTGKVKWRCPLSSAYGTRSQDISHRLRMEDLNIELCVSDFNSDGVLDFVMPRETGCDQPPIEDQPVELVALSGVDGSVLWKRALPKMGSSDGRLSRVPPPVIADLDGDGVPEVINMTIEDDTHAGQHRIMHLQALEGSNGRLRWDWNHVVSKYYGDDRSVQNRPRPIVLRTRTGLSRIGAVIVGITNRAPSSWLSAVFVDHVGKTVNEFPLLAADQTASNSSTRAVDQNVKRFYPFDVDDDGDDEVIFWKGSAVVAVEATEPAKILWQCNIPALRTPELSGLVTHVSHADPASMKTRRADTLTEAPGTVAVLKQGSDTNNLIGIDVRSGEISWFCAGPTGSSKRRPFIRSAEILGQVAGGPPQVVYQFEDFLICRQAAATSLLRQARKTRPLQTGSEVTLVSVPHRLRTPATQKPMLSDPRNERYLPWARAFGKPYLQWTMRILGWTIFCCIALVLIPAVIVYYLIQRMRFDGIAVVGMIAVCIAIYVGLAVGSAEGKIDTKLNRIIFAIMPLPVIYLVCRWFYQLMRGQWQQVIGYPAVTVLASVVLAGIVFLSEYFLSDMALQQHEKYTLAGWYLILVWGIYATGFLMTLSAGASLVLRQVRSTRTKQEIAQVQ